MIDEKKIEEAAIENSKKLSYSKHYRDLVVGFKLVLAGLSMSSWSNYAKVTKITSWLYLDDLFPKKEGNCD